MILPVPTAGIIAAIALMFMTAGFPPNAAQTRSLGRPRSPFRILCVPASSEFNAETRVAFPHPTHQIKSTNDSYEGEKQNMPVFCIVCKLPAGKIVILPGVNVSLTSLAPFSSIIFVFVAPSTATTKFAARGW